MAKVVRMKMFSLKGQRDALVIGHCHHVLFDPSVNEMERDGREVVNNEQTFEFFVGLFLVPVIEFRQRRVTNLINLTRI